MIRGRECSPRELVAGRISVFFLVFVGLVFRPADGAASAEAYTVRLYDVSDLLRPPDGGQRRGEEGTGEGTSLAHLTRLIRTVVLPGSWRDPRALIRPAGDGRLAIAQSALGHALLEQLFADLRRHRAATIRLRARLFTYYRPATVGIIARSMGLEGGGGVRLVLPPERARSLAKALTDRSDVREMAVPTMTVLSGVRACASVGTETVLSTRWQRSGSAPRVLDDAVLRIASFEGHTLEVVATLAGDRATILLQVGVSSTFLAGGRAVADRWGRIDLPEFAASRMYLTALVPQGHTLLVGGLRGRLEEGEASLSRGRPVNVLLMLTPTLVGTAGKGDGEGRRRLALEEMAVLARMRSWAPAGPTTQDSGGSVPSLGRITVLSPDGRVRLDLEIDPSQVRAPAVRRWLMRLLERPGLQVRAGGESDSVGN